MSKTAILVPLRITVVDPPAGVQFRLQRGRDDLVSPTRVTSTEIQFDFTLRLGPSSGGRPNLLGEAAQGPPAGRFVYVNSGRKAGQRGTPWDRRAKVHLAGITLRLVESALSRDGKLVEARIAGTASDGGPVCATVPLLGDGWHLTSGPAA